MRHFVCAGAALLLAGGASAGDFQFGDLLQKAVKALPAALPANSAAPMSTDDAVQTLTRAKDAVIDLNESDEIALGKGIAANLLGAAPLLDDKAKQDYVNRVGRWVASQSERPDLPWKFGVLDDDSINAFAVPGGMVFVTRGLLAKLNNEAELAGVLSHEIAHVVCKHHLNAIKANARAGLLKSAADRYMARRGDGNSELASRLVAGGTELLARGLDKSDEFEADRTAVGYAARSGYDPYGLPAVLQTLQAAKADSAGMALLFKTHPPLAARLDALSVAMAPLDRFDGQPSLEARFQSVMGKP